MTYQRPTAILQEAQGGTQVVTEACGFLTIVIGTFLLHATRDLDISFRQLAQLTRAGQADGRLVTPGDLPLRSLGSFGLPNGARHMSPNPRGGLGDETWK